MDAAFSTKDQDDMVRSLCVEDPGLHRCDRRGVVQACPPAKDPEEFRMHRWMNSERFGCEEGHPTKISELHGLGGVRHEVLCGRVPFGHRSKDFIAMLRVTEGLYSKIREAVRGGGRIKEGAWFTDRL